MEPNRGAVDFHHRAHRAEHALGVITRAYRFVNRYRYTACQAGERERALHLRAGGGTLVVQGPELSSLHRHGEAVAILFDELRTHRAKRHCDSSHRTPPQRLITYQPRGK